MTRNTNGRRGLTLLEVLVAVALLVVLFGALFTFLYDTLAARARALEHTGRQLAAATLFERLERELPACLVGDRESGAGVAGDGASLKISSRGVAAALAERGASDPEVLGDLQRMEYRFDRESGRIEARHLAAGDGEGGAFAPLGGAVHLVRFRYHDGTAWRDSFDSLEADRLPLAVEVAIWFDGPGGSQDEAAFERDSREPRPDRMRVIAVPDAAGEADEPPRDGASGDEAPERPAPAEGPE